MIQRRLLLQAGMVTNAAVHLTRTRKFIQPSGMLFLRLNAGR
jgi:hypothetical protein